MEYNKKYAVEGRECSMENMTLEQVKAGAIKLSKSIKQLLESKRSILSTLILCYVR